MTAYSPIPTAKRIDLLDMLRGFALSGILITNMVEHCYDYSQPTLPSELSVWTTGFVSALTEGSFYPLFSLLFGIGFAVWMDRSMKNNGSVWLFAWRSCVLFLFACALMIFIDTNNILLRYSLLSIPLLLFYKASPKILLTAAIVFLLIGVLHRPITKQLQSMRSPQTQARVQNRIKNSIQAYQLAREEAEKTKTFLSFSKARAVNFSNQLKIVFTFWDKTLPLIFSMFLLGMFCWRKGLFTSVEKHILIWKRIFWIGLIFGLAGNLFVFVSQLLEYKQVITTNHDILNYIEIILNPILTFFYISLFVLAIQKVKSTKNIIIDALKATGRMAFTNFFLQHILIAALMYPYGLGLEERLFSYHLVLGALSFYLLQILFSVFWLNHFAYGPMEWLWRSLTYMKFQSMRRF